MGQTRLVLASASPRRRDLLAQLKIVFEVDAADVDESPRAGEAGTVYVERLAREKAAVVARRHPGALVLAADTSVIVDEVILGKPSSAAEAKQMLARLSGRSHQVKTGIAVAGHSPAAQVVTTRVTFRTLNPAEIAWYVQSGEPLDKAGAYAIQGIGGFCVASIEGSHSNVVGLPLVETLALLLDAGITLPWGGSR